MNIRDCILTLQRMGWLLRDEGGHAAKEVTPILQELIVTNQLGCPVCDQQMPQIAFNAEAPAAPKRPRGRPKKDPFAP